MQTITNACTCASLALDELHGHTDVDTIGAACVPYQGPNPYQELRQTRANTRARTQVGVFVSIVSTKIPFKGAGKEYIGDDIEEMVGAVKHAIQACCVQVGPASGEASVGSALRHVLCALDWI